MSSTAPALTVGERLDRLAIGRFHWRMFALIGGALFSIGAQFARGCTSGAALSGMAVMSLGGILTMFAIFGSAYGTAFFFRRLWLPPKEAR